MRHLQRLATLSYAVAGILILFPALDLIQAMWPVQLGELNWRVAAAGLLSRLLVTPLLALVLAYGTALLLKQRRTLRALAVLNVVLVSVLVVGLGSFALDAVQLRGEVRSDAQTTYDLGIAISFAKYGIALIMLILLTIGEWRSSRTLAVGGGDASQGSVLLYPEAARSAETPDVEASEPSE